MLGIGVLCLIIIDIIILTIYTVVSRHILTVVTVESGENPQDQEGVIT